MRVGAVGLGADCGNFPQGPHKMGFPKHPGARASGVGSKANEDLCPTGVLGREHCLASGTGAREGYVVEGDPSRDGGAEQGCPVRLSRGPAAPRHPAGG